MARRPCSGSVANIPRIMEESMTKLSQSLNNNIQTNKGNTVKHTQTKHKLLASWVLIVVTFMVINLTNYVAEVLTLSGLPKTIIV